MKKSLFLALGVMALAILWACGKKDDAPEKTAKQMPPTKPGVGKVTPTPGDIAVPPAEKHKSVSPPSPDMSGEWVIEPSERQRLINAQLAARGKKPQETTLKIENGHFELTTKVEPVETTISGDAKQEGTKVTLTPTAAESKMNGKPIKSRVPPPWVFTLQTDQLTIKDSQGLVYVRK